jgi:hypothetical protein
VLKLLLLSSKLGKLANFYCLAPITIAWTTVLSHLPAASFHAAQISLSITCPHTPTMSTQQLNIPRFCSACFGGNKKETLKSHLLVLCASIQSILSLAIDEL